MVVPIGFATAEITNEGKVLAANRTVNFQGSQRAKVSSYCNHKVVVHSYLGIERVGKRVGLCQSNLAYIQRSVAIALNMVFVLRPCLAVGFFCPFNHIYHEVFGKTFKGAISQCGRCGTERVDGTKRRATLKGIGRDCFQFYGKGNYFQATHVGEGAVAERGNGTHIKFFELLYILVAVYVASDVGNGYQV